jgi:hypothetical protein
MNVKGDFIFFYYYSYYCYYLTLNKINNNNNNKKVNLNTLHSYELIINDHFCKRERERIKKSSVKLRQSNQNERKKSRIIINILCLLVQVISMLT